MKISTFANSIKSYLYFLTLLSTILLMENVLAVENETSTSQNNSTSETRTDRNTDGYHPYETVYLNHMNQEEFSMTVYLKEEPDIPGYHAGTMVVKSKKPNSQAIGIKIPLHTQTFLFSDKAYESAKRIKDGDSLKFVMLNDKLIFLASLLSGHEEMRRAFPATYIRNTNEYGCSLTIDTFLFTEAVQRIMSSYLWNSIGAELQPVTVKSVTQPLEPYDTTNTRSYSLSISDEFSYTWTTGNNNFLHAPYSSDGSPIEVSKFYQSDDLIAMLVVATNMSIAARDNNKTTFLDLDNEKRYSITVHLKVDPADPDAHIGTMVVQSTNPESLPIGIQIPPHKGVLLFSEKSYEEAKKLNYGETVEFIMINFSLIHFAYELSSGDTMRASFPERYTANTRDYNCHLTINTLCYMEKIKEFRCNLSLQTAEESASDPFQTVTVTSNTHNIESHQDDHVNKHSLTLGIETIRFTWILSEICNLTTSSITPLPLNTSYSLSTDENITPERRAFLLNMGFVALRDSDSILAIFPDQTGGDGGVVQQTQPGDIFFYGYNDSEYILFKAPPNSESTLTIEIKTLLDVEYTNQYDPMIERISF